MAAVIFRHYSSCENAKKKTMSMAEWIKKISMALAWQVLHRVPALLPCPCKPSWPTRPTKMAFSSSSFSFAPKAAQRQKNRNSSRKLPVLLFDIMDTIVRDPFYHDVPPFFGMSFKELIDCKHPTAWIEFEKGLIDEVELANKFFKDGRSFDLEGLKDCMRRGYSYIDGVEDLLCALKQNNYEMHAFTNYPIWYRMIEEKLNVSTYLSWTFCSCTTGKRKPDSDFYLEVVRHLNVDPASCIFVDDRLGNVEAAIEVGIIGLHFKNADMLREELSRHGVDISADEYLRGRKPKPSEEHK